VFTSFRYFQTLGTDVREKLSTGLKTLSGFGDTHLKPQIAVLLKGSQAIFGIFFRNKRKRALEYPTFQYLKIVFWPSEICLIMNVRFLSASIHCDSLECNFYEFNLKKKSVCSLQLNPSSNCHPWHSWDAKTQKFQLGFATQWFHDTLKYSEILSIVRRSGRTRLTANLFVGARQHLTEYEKEKMGRKYVGESKAERIRSE